MKKFCPALLVWFLSLAGVNESIRPQVESTTVSQVEVILSEEGEPAQQATRAESGLYFPDYVDGGGWSVQLAISNVARRVSAAVVVTAYDQDGQPLPEFFDSETTFEIPPLGSQVLRSVGTGEIRRGWIEVRSNPPAASGLLTYRHSGSGVEVGVAPVPLGDGFALFVEESSEIGTGLALFKPEADSEVEFRLRDEAGTDPFGQDLTVGDFQQQARTLPEWLDPIGATFLGDFRGLLMLRSGEDASFAPLGLRFGKRKTSLSAVPGIPFLGEDSPPNPFQAGPSAAGPLYFPDYVDGGGWSVQLALANLDSAQSVPVQVEVYDQTGRSMDGLFDTAIHFELPAQGSRVLRSAGGTRIRRGWIKVQAESASVRGLLVYRHGETGIEVGVAPVEPRDEFALFVEESSEIGTGLALFKPEADSRVEFRIRDEAGNDPLGDVYVPWRNFRQSARTLTEWLDVDGVETAFLKDFRGLLFLRTEDGSEFAPLGLRFGKETSALSAVPGIGIVDGVRIAGGVGSDGGVEIDGGVGIDGGGMVPPPTVTLSVAPSSIDRGRSATLRWSSTNADSVEITPDIGKVSTSGTREVSPRTTTTYRITVRAADGQTATATVTVRVAITERAVLEALYEATDGPNWTDNTNWLTDAPLGEWYGVDTDDSGRVVRIDLAGKFDYHPRVDHGLKGSIPSELGNLTNLEELSLGINDLRGTIPPELGNLANLKRISLGYNLLNGVIPPEFGHLANLEVIWLRNNALTGTIPPELGRLTNLKYLDIRNNSLTGPVPSELANLVNLRRLDLGYNSLTGPIPPWVANLKDLFDLSLRFNNFTGTIPPELGNLGGLNGHLLLEFNNLTGPIPAELGNLDELLWLSVQANDLTGPIPPELGNLTNLESLQLAANDLTGAVPAELGNLENLERISLGGNRLTGSLPLNFVRLPNLTFVECRESEGVCVPATDEFREWIRQVEITDGSIVIPFCDQVDKQVLRDLYEATSGRSWTRSDGWLEDDNLDRWHGVQTDSIGRVSGLDLSGNGLSGHVPGALGRLASLRELRIRDNPLSGRLPLSLTRLPLDEFDYADTSLCVAEDGGFEAWLKGIPRHVGTGVECPPLTDREILELLYLTTGGPDWSESAGWLSDPFTEWHGVETDPAGRVVELRLNGNSLSGLIPAELGGLSNLEVLEFANNDLSGAIPPELGGLKHLERLGLASNRLEGAIPPELGGLPKLTRLDLAGNRLSGTIPPELGDLDQLTFLDLRSNWLSGEIPSELSSLGNLEYLSLSSNPLSGSIPWALGALARLRSLDLRRNQLAGAIPVELARLQALERMQLADNELAGRIPAGLGGLSHLSVLNLSDNQLTGPIPVELGNLHELTVLALGGNALTGSVPSTIGQLSDLERLLLEDNELEGSVPSHFGALTVLQQLKLTNNAGMTGHLPAELTALTRLAVFLAGGTELCVPSHPAFETWLGGIHRGWIARCPEASRSTAYLVQAVQSRQFPVPLVAGEDALLRVFVTARVATGEGIPPVRARFFVDDQEAHVQDIAGKRSPIPTVVDESSLDRSANAVIPGRVVRPGLEMVIEVDPDQTLDPGLGVAKRIPETGRLRVDVRNTPAFDLTLIPFLWEEHPDSSIVELVKAMAADPRNHEMLHLTQTLLPVAEMRVRAHEPVVFPTNNAFELLHATDVIRVMEGGTGYYKGMMSGEVTGAGGVAHRPGRSSFSSPHGPTLAHELGHNMSLSHAGCHVPDPDPAFPHVKGAIGAWGYDYREGALVAPFSPDVMSYCFSNQWISDFHFSNALGFRLSDYDHPALPDRAAENRPPLLLGGVAASGRLSSLVTAPANSLLLWGGVDARGTPFLEPAFIVEAPAALPRSTGEYQIIGRNTDGDELFSLTFEMPEVADGDGGSSFAFVMPVKPEWADELAGITLSGPGGSVTLDQDTDRPVTILRNPRTGQIRAILHGAKAAPQNVDVTVSTMSVDPGLERLTSHGLPDPEDWFR